MDMEAVASLHYHLYMHFLCQVESGKIFKIWPRNVKFIYAALIFFRP